MTENNNMETEEISEEKIPEKETENTEDILKEKDREIEDLNNQLLRLQADFVNFRKRSEKEKESTIIYALESFLLSLLPIIDNFQRAIESAENKEDGFYKGVEMIYQQLLKILNDNDVEEIVSLGEDFDPNLHHAVFMEDNDDYESGKIIEVLQKGYKLKERVIRPSMVKVAK